MRKAAVGRVPRIFVSSVPTELLQLDGPAQLKPIAETRLLWVENSDDDLFFDVAGQKFYALVSGRWFRADALDGSWSAVAAGELPADFGRIPIDHPRGDVLAAVPKSELAAEAMVANEIPETATIRIADARLQVRYDGAPRFVPIAGTLLRYAVNSETPVIELAGALRVAGGGLYYALSDGVWFQSASPAGPWRAATSVPGAIYDMPTSTPISYVTHARVYGANAELVRVGYTPGYFGTCLTASGTVVFGTGERHAPWIGARWIGRPATYGFSARWEPVLGWSLGKRRRFGAPAQVRPWWDPSRRGSERRADAEEEIDLYERWGDVAVHAPARPRDGTRGTAVKADDLYAGADGRVYRAAGDSWERYGVDGWQPASLASLRAAGRAAAASRDELTLLGRERAGRRRGEERWELYREIAATTP
jgi:hypothetical protein